MREQLPLFGRLWVLLCCLGGASEAADLPLRKTLFLMSEATPAPATRLLQPIATEATRAQLAKADYTDAQEWQLEASGQPGRILIKHPKTNSFLMAEDIAEDDKPARVLLTPIAPGGNVSLTTAHQWRVLDAENGAFMFQNVQTGRMLEADPATIASADGQTTLQA